MNAERWQRVKKVFDAAVELAPGEREAFLDEACGSDHDGLRSDVEGLLGSFDDSESFLEDPAAAEVASMIVEPAALEPGKFFGRYKIVKLLGAGGMGEVYLAEDNKLGRRVAIKIVNEKFARNESNLKRFTQEARAASGLNHPNILVIYEIGEHDGANYLVSEYVEGKTLRDSFVDRPLKLSGLLDTAIQIAGALAAAHAAGIVHRDIKPENIMVRPDGYAKILDFGLAKLVDSKEVGFEDETVQHNQTAKGVILGTVNYMSPEQAKGERVDHRTDIFSFGVVVYEMVAGRTPFGGDSMSEAFANLINSEPQPLSRFASNLPDELARIVSKTLRKDKNERYQTMKDLREDLKSLRENLAFDERLERSRGGEESNSNLAKTTGDSNKSTGETSYNSIAGFNRGRLNMFAAAAVVLVAALALGYYYWSSAGSGASGTRSLAVLPFINASMDPGAEYLSDGITESVINDLSQLPGLRVMSRNSAFRFRDDQGDTRRIAAQLGVESLITGDIKQVGDKLVINVRLINAGDDSQTWGTQYVKSPTDVITVQHEIARDISRKLGPQLSRAAEKSFGKTTANPEAYQLYLKARYLSEKYSSPDTRKALALFDQAIELDPNFAAAYAYRAASLTGLLGSRGVSLRETIARMRADVLKAIELDDELATAHEVYGSILANFDHNFGAAEREFIRALELDPNDASARETYGGLLSILGRHDESLVQMEQAIEINRLSPSLVASYGNCLVAARRYADAIAQYESSLLLESRYIPALDGLATVYQLQGDHARSVEMRARVAEASGDDKAAAFIRGSFSKRGWTGFMREMTENTEAPPMRNLLKTTFYTELGDKDKAFAVLNLMLEEGSPSLPRINTDPRLDPIRDDARFAEILKRMNL